MTAILLRSAQIAGLDALVKNQVYIANGNLDSNAIYVANLTQYLAPTPSDTVVYNGTASQDFTYIPGEQTFFDSVADNGSGQCRLHFSTPHPFAEGDPISIYSSVANYCFNPTVMYVDSTHIDVPKAFEGTATGLIWRGCRLKSNIPPYYRHKISFTGYVKGATGQTLTLSLRDRNFTTLPSTDVNIATTTGTWIQTYINPVVMDIAEDNEIIFQFRYTTTGSILFESLTITVERIL